MKAPLIFPIAFSMWLVAGVPALFGREAVKDLRDLENLESRVARVSELTLPATVALVSEKLGASGSGVVTSADGLILTAAHVVDGAGEVTVVFPDGKQVPGKVLGANRDRDIAMVQISEKGTWPHRELGASKPLDAGDWVVALGHSAGFDPARTPPVRFGRVISKGPGNYLTTDCTLIGGDSGGPLFDLDGRVIAINSSIGWALQNNNHAGIDGFKEDWERLKKGDTWGKLEMNPMRNPELPALGIRMIGDPNVNGVVVESVVPSSPAAGAGVRGGDIIRTLNGNRIEDDGDLKLNLAKLQAGDKVLLGITRDEGKLEVEVTLQRLERLFEQK